jgi:hypothetical protein
MSFIRRFLGSVLLCLACNGSVFAAGYVLGLGAAADTEDGRAITAFGDFGVGENTWLSGTFGSTETNGIAGGFSTTFADVGIDHYFNPVGIRLSGAHWGDSDILDSDDVRASLYYRDDIASFSADYERRNFDFIFGSLLLDERRKAEFHADGWGLTSRIQVSDRITVRLSGMHYGYSRDIRIQPEIDVLRFLSASRLSLMNSLIDYRINAGMEFRFGLRSIDVSAGSWKTAVDQSKVDSYTIGFLTPVSDRTDIEFRFSFDDSENFGNTTALTVYLYYFGGS